MAGGLGALLGVFILAQFIITVLEKVVNCC